MTAQQEVELKLDVSPDAVEALLASGLLAGDPSITPLRSVYFDTPEQALSAAGFSLRIRQTPHGRIQTVKAAGTAAAGLFARPEWERGVEGDKPVLDDTTPIPVLLGSRIRDIGPAFAVEVERRVWLVGWEDATIEVALDRGEIAAGERRAPVFEIELELKQGQPSALFSFARRLNSVTPVRLGVLSKAERGFRLLGPAMRAVKAEPIGLATDMTVAEAFRRIVEACLRQFRLNEPLIDLGNPEALHQARVALRRLRSALSIFRPMLEEDGSFEHMREELRWLAGALGDARDTDVLSLRAGEDALRERLEEARRQAYEQAKASLGSDRARSIMLDLTEWLALGGWLRADSIEEIRTRPVGDFAIVALDYLRKKVKKSGKHIENIDDKARHDLRKGAKKLRYASEFFAPLFGRKRQQRRAENFLAALETLQDHLGDLNDLAAAPDLFARMGLGDDDAPGKPLGRMADKRRLIGEAAEAIDALLDAKRFWR